MEKARFELLLENNTVFKVNTIGGGIFKDKNELTVIQFMFMHNGDLNNNDTYPPPKKRIFLETFPFKNLIPELKALSISDPLIILANADDLNYALSYELNIDPEKRIIKVQLLDYPEIGDSFLTLEEKNGIEVVF